MLTIARHLLSIVILPFSVTVVIPWWIARRNNVLVSAPRTSGEAVLLGVGVALLVIGVVLFVASLRRFAAEGKGTLAPWDPPREFVVTGPYRYVRNPMITGVIVVLAGEAAVLRSVPHATWAVTFFALNAVFIPLLEEPQLRRRFGAPYEEYCRNVGRLIPRLTPWNSGAKGSR